MASKNGNWQTFSSKELLKTRHFRVLEDQLHSPFDQHFKYVYVQKPSAVMVAAQYDCTRWVFVSQYRHPIGQVTLEFPAGGIEASEEPATAAARELLEETGFQALELEEVTALHTSTGTSSELVHYFVAKELFKPQTQIPGDVSEVDLEPVCLSLEEARAEIASGKITCLGTMALVFWLSYQEMDA